MDTPTPDNNDVEDDLERLQIHEPSHHTPPTEITTIVLGDLVICVRSDDEDETRLYRVSSTTLRNSSQYFERLLSTKYAEGSRVAAELSMLRQQDGETDITAIPSTKLPMVEVQGVGETSQVKSIGPLMAEFFRILHGVSNAPIESSRPSWTTPPKSRQNKGEAAPKDLPATARKTPLINIANLAIVADRFDASSVMLQAAKKHGWLANAKLNTDVVKLSANSEETIRQRLLVGILLNYDPWITFYSMQLIVSGSKLWINSDSFDNSSTHQNGAVPVALWHDLPRGIEEELQLRRASILSTIQSLQDHLLEQYTKKAHFGQQCRLGYDTSPQCDSFQLGEFVKHLVKIGTLDLTGPAGFSSSSDAKSDGHLQSCATYDKSIRTLISALRAIPSHQVNNNHAHCGPKKHLTTALDYVDTLLSNENFVGICGSCWFDSRDDAEGKSWASRGVRDRMAKPKRGRDLGADDLLSRRPPAVEQAGKGSRRHGKVDVAWRASPVLRGYVCKAGKGKEHERANMCFCEEWDWGKFLGAEY